MSVFPRRLRPTALRTNTHVHMYTFTHIPIHMYTYTHIHICAYIHTPDLGVVVVYYCSAYYKAVRVGGGG